jgi:hypothetical protein
MKYFHKTRKSQNMLLTLIVLTIVMTIESTTILKQHQQQSQIAVFA